MVSSFLLILVQHQEACFSFRACTKKPHSKKRQQHNDVVSSLRTPTPFPLSPYPVGSSNVTVFPFTRPIRETLAWRDASRRASCEPRFSPISVTFSNWCLTFFLLPLRRGTLARWKRKYLGGQRTIQIVPTVSSLAKTKKTSTWFGHFARTPLPSFQSNPSVSIT